MECECSVTFEFDSRPPMLYRSTIAGSQVATCVSRATKLAQQVLMPYYWTSMVVVVVERRGLGAGITGAEVSEAAS
jgi:hypothetical protein